MTLSMKSYKGFNKFPYCNAHIPQVKPTTTVHSLEARRLAELTKLQSQVKYHENFEKSKGKLTQIADDMETQRLKQTSKIISNVSYHGELERKQQMEHKRNQQQSELQEQTKVANHNLINAHLNNHSHLKNGHSYHLDHTTQQLNSLNLNNTNNHHQSPQYKGQQPVNVFNGQSVYQAQIKEPHTVQILHQQQQQKQPIAKQQENHIYQLHQTSLPATQCAPQQEYINPQKVAQYVNTSQQLLHHQQQRQQQQLINQQFGNNSQIQSANNQQIVYKNQYNNQFNGNQDHYIHQAQAQQPNIYLQQKQQQQDWSPAVDQQQNRVFRAMYDYTAADADEVSFIDGYLITDCVFIDEGWMYGKISRTGQHGMIPCNYCAPASLHA